jgi:hypothetical protein
VASSAESLLKSELQTIAKRTARESAEAEIKRSGKKKFSNLQPAAFREAGGIRRIQDYLFHKRGAE